MTRRIVVPLLTVALVLALGVLTRPRPPALATDATGDAALAAAVSTAATRTGTTAHRLAVATVELDAGSGEPQVTLAGLGADADDTFEIGSVTKAVTGLLLAAAVERGEVTPDQPVGELLDLGDSPAADLTLEQLATHRSGLPRLAGGVDMLRRALWAQLSGSNPYGGLAPDDVTRAARDASLGEHPEGEYSNLGAALLGQALAAAAGTTYPELVEQRVATPLSLRSTTVPGSPDALARLVPADVRVDGRAPSGRAQDPWTMDGYAPAGGVRSTSRDLATLLAALLTGTDPALTEALEPRADLGDDRIGMFWITSEVDTGGGGARTVTWHNGRTGGFSAFVGLDRERGRAVAVLSDVAAGVDDLALDLLTDDALGGTR